MDQTTQIPSIINADYFKQKANGITNRKTLYAAGAGLIPIPILDIATLLGVQITMIRDIAIVYGQKHTFDRNQVKSFIITLIGDLGTVGVVSGVKAIPGVGSIIGLATAPITNAAATYALGKVFTNHFDQGGNLLDFDPISSRSYFHQHFEEGQHLVAKDEINTNSKHASANAKEKLLEESKKLLKSFESLHEKINSLSTADTGAITDLKSMVPSAIKSLNEAGITSLRDLLNGLADSIDSLLKNIGENFNIMDRNTWPSELRAFVDTEAENLKAMQTNLMEKDKSDLTVAEGIGDSLERMLNNAGITSLEDLTSKIGGALEGIIKKASSSFNSGDSRAGIRQVTFINTRSSVQSEEVTTSPEQGTSGGGRKGVFTIVEGIGPKIDEVLRNAGLSRLEDLADKTVEELKQILSDAGSRFNRHNPSTWPKQAKLAAAGEMDKLKELQDQLNNRN